MKIHSVWDEAAIQSSRIWSVSEWAEELDRKSAKEIKAIVKGTPQDWLEDNAIEIMVDKLNEYNYDCVFCNFYMNTVSLHLLNDKKKDEEQIDELNNETNDENASTDDKLWSC